MISDRVALYILLFLCIFAGAALSDQGDIIAHQRALIREMSKNPACMVDNTGK